jgi:hypothetical protein
MRRHTMTSSDEMINELRVKEKLLREKLEDLRKPIQQVEKDLQHILGTIEFYERNGSNTFVENAESVVVAVKTIPLSRLQGLTHSEAVVAIAKYNGGVVRAQDAKRMMIKAGIMKQTKNSTNMTHNAIIRTDRFDRIAPGEYRLKSEPSKDKKDEVTELFHVPVQ